MAKVSGLVIKAMVYWRSEINRYELYHVRTGVSKQILILLLIHGTDQFSEYKSNYSYPQEEGLWSYTLHVD